MNEREKRSVCVKPVLEVYGSAGTAESLVSLADLLLRASGLGKTSELTV